MASTEIKTLTIGGNTYALNDVAARALIEAIQIALSDLSTIRSGAALGATAVQPSSLSAVATSGSYNDLEDKPTIGDALLKIFITDVGAYTFSANKSGGQITNIILSKVAATGSYNDLSDKPTIPDVSSKQDTLISGTNIKTVNGQSLLGSGNIPIEVGSGGLTADEAVKFNTNHIIANSSVGYIVTFDAGNARNYYVIEMGRGSTTLTITLNAYVETENYILINNSNNENDVTVSIGGMEYQGSTVDPAVVPKDGIVVKANQYLEMSYAVFSIGGTAHIGVITCSSELTDQN